jgi:hypothetical protein
LLKFDHKQGNAGMKKVCAFVFSIFVAGCNSGDTQSNVTAPGARKATDTAILEAGAAVLQTQPPIAAINAYLDGFHFYSGRMHVQMEAHHYCAILNEELIQCIIYDGNTGDAKIMGVEYIISSELFADLPSSEKALWHSHVHEVKSGQLIAPGIPELAEHALMEKLIHTYGKTWHTWHTDLDKKLPLGVPQLMMGFTQDGQSDPVMIKARDERFNIDSQKKREDRSDIAAPAVDPEADGWERGRTVQISDPTGSEHHHDDAAETNQPARREGENSRATPTQ